MVQKEAKARLRINDCLIRAGWRFFDCDGGPANVALEAHVKIKKKTLDEFPVAVLEAKSEGLNPPQESFGHFHAFKPNPETLIGEKIEDNYVAVTQNPNYRNDPRWNDISNKHRSVYDPACSIGGMLSVAKEHLSDRAMNDIQGATR